MRPDGAVQSVGAHPSSRTWLATAARCRRLVLSAVTVAAALGCGYGVTESGSRAAQDTTTGDGGGSFQRATLTVTVQVAAEDSALAAAVGSRGRLLEHAVVTVQRQTQSDVLAADTTAEPGTVTFGGLIPGTYVVSASRVLSAAETAIFGSADADVNAFGGGRTVNVEAPATELIVEAAAGRRGSLIISEIFAYNPKFGPQGITEYHFGMFIELYNNADTSIALAGRTLGISLVHWHDFSSGGGLSCEELERWRNDPEGVWSRYFYAFPGSAGSLAPGAAVVVATDAIDHRSVLAGFLDLSGADFEFPGGNDVDNPAVPNMIDIGVAEWAASVDGHGLWFPDGAAFVADRVDPGALPFEDLPLVSARYAQIPRDAILDVFTTTKTPALEAGWEAMGLPVCPEMVNRIFDRLYANLYDRQVPLSMRRKVFATLPDGRVILLRTRSSANDFELAAPTPGKVP